MNRYPILAIDVGNTTIVLGLVTGPQTGGEDMTIWSLPSDRLATADSLGLAVTGLLAIAGLAPTDLAAWVVCSVVPQVDAAIAAAAERYSRCRAYFAGTPEGGLPMSLENRYEKPGEVGADRLVGAFAATRLFPAPGHIVIDFGTATTFDCVAEGAYLGGLIFPGLTSSARAMAATTAKLPLASLEVDTRALNIGRTTTDSLNMGLVFGFVAAAEGLVARLQPRLPADSRVVATGGLARKLAGFTAVFDHVRPNLLLDGLRLLYAQAPEQPRTTS